VLTYRIFLFKAIHYLINAREIGEVMVARALMLILFCFFTMTSSVLSKHINYTGREKVSLISTVETRNCFVSYVMIKDTVYLLKQKKDPNKQLAVVRDALAAWVAKDLDIAHHVAIVPFKNQFPGKRPSWPATLHTLAQGKTVREQRDSKYNTLRLRQFWAHVATFNEKGLTKDIIKYMTWHRQLPIIVALDLMIGNSDRHCGNLCYDSYTDTFCAIDMDDTFNKDLCLLACKKLKCMMQDDVVIFTKEEIIALQAMRDALKFLVCRHKPSDLIAQLYYFAKKAGFHKGSKIYTDNIGRKLAHYERMIRKSNKSAHKLISLLDTIITHKSQEID